MGTCEPSNYHKTLLITNDKILLFSEKNGEQKILEKPERTNEKCTIVKEKGYAFDCRDNSPLEYNGISLSFSTRFDGKNKYTSTSGLSGGGKYIENRNMTCELE